MAAALLTSIANSEMAVPGEGKTKAPRHPENDRDIIIMLFINTLTVTSNCIGASRTHTNIGLMRKAIWERQINLNLRCEHL